MLLTEEALRSRSTMDAMARDMDELHNHIEQRKMVRSCGRCTGTEAPCRPFWLLWLLCSSVPAGEQVQRGQHRWCSAWLAHHHRRPAVHSQYFWGGSSVPGRRADRVCGGCGVPEGRRDPSPVGRPGAGKLFSGKGTHAFPAAPTTRAHTPAPPACPQIVSDVDRVPLGSPRP